MTCTHYRDASALFGAVGMDCMAAAGCGGGDHLMDPMEALEGFWKAEVFLFRGSERSDGAEGAKLLPEDPH